MSLLGEFERRLERAVEGFFARVFRSGVHPVEIGRRVLRVMEDGKVSTLRQTYVPNVYRITLSQSDYARLAPLEPRLVEELEVFVSEACRTHDWVLPEPPRVSFASAQRLSPGEFRIDAQAVAIPSAGAGAQSPASLTVIEDGRSRPVPIAGTVKIGRQADNDIVISDPGVSRHHAHVVAGANGSYLVKDLDSTNGTTVNGSFVREHQLRDGDRIVVGHTVIEFKRS